MGDLPQLEAGRAARVNQVLRDAGLPAAENEIELTFLLNARDARETALQGIRQAYLEHAQKALSVMNDPRRSVSEQRTWIASLRAQDAHRRALERQVELLTEHLAEQALALRRAHFAELLAG